MYRARIWIGSKSAALCHRTIITSCVTSSACPESSISRRKYELMRGAKKSNNSVNAVWSRLSAHGSRKQYKALMLLGLHSNGQ